LTYCLPAAILVIAAVLILKRDLSDSVIACCIKLNKKEGERFNRSISLNAIDYMGN